MIYFRPPGAAADSSQTDTMSLLKTVPSNHNLLSLRYVRHFSNYIYAQVDDIKLNKCLIFWNILNRVLQ